MHTHMKIGKIHTRIIYVTCLMQRMRYYKFIRLLPSLKSSVLLLPLQLLCLLPSLLFWDASPPIDRCSVSQYLSQRPLVNVPDSNSQAPWGDSGGTYVMFEASMSPSLAGLLAPRVSHCQIKTAILVLYLLSLYTRLQNYVHVFKNLKRAIKHIKGVSPTNCQVHTLGAGR